MVDKRTHNPADLVKHYTDLINEERLKMEECFANIVEYADQLRRVADDARQRLIARS